LTVGSRGGFRAGGGGFGIDLAVLLALVGDGFGLQFWPSDCGRIGGLEGA
jgi:hypothetical protein